MVTFAKYCTMFFLIVYIEITFSANDKLSYFSPTDNSIMISSETEIILRPKAEFYQDFLDDIPDLKISGQTSGIHNYNVYVSPDTKTFVIKPIRKFSEGERVHISTGIAPDVSANTQVFDIQFSFTISKGDLNNPGELRSKNKNDTGENVWFNSQINYSHSDPLPPDMHKILKTVHNENFDDMYYFFGSCIFNEPYDSYIVIADNNGNPIFFRKMNAPVYDFKKQPDGRLTYFDGETEKFYVLNSRYELVDSIAVKYGYNTDFHELIFDKNGHAILFAYDKQRIDMSVIVSGGQPEARVYGLILQELDINKEVIFQWRGWDHLEMTNSADYVDLTQVGIDYVHGNSIMIDHDNNLVLSLRNYNEVAKIDRETGEFIYRLGGKANEFTISGDPHEFYSQHDARILNNGHLTLFDNGAHRNPKFSRVVEYQLDESLKTANLVWQYSPTPSFYAGSMCNAQFLPNNNWLVSWAGWSGRAFSEVTPAGEILNEFFFENGGRSYRVLKDHWESDFVTLSTDSINFGVVKYNTNDVREVILKNNTSEPIKITEYYTTLSPFAILEQLPLVIKSNSETTIHVTFSPTKSDILFSDTLRLCADTEGERRSKRIKLLGKSSLSSFENVIEKEYLFKISDFYPNPFNPNTSITVSLAARSHLKIVIYDNLGRLVKTLVNSSRVKGEHLFDFNGGNLSSGIYYSFIEIDGQSFYRKLVLVK